MCPQAGAKTVDSLAPRADIFASRATSLDSGRARSFASRAWLATMDASLSICHPWAQARGANVRVRSGLAMDDKDQAKLASMEQKS
jgi:hypothetical protein